MRNALILSIVVLSGLALLPGCRAQPSEDCVAAATAIKAHSMLKLASEEYGEALKAAARELQTAAAQHCRDDAWSPAAIACFKSLETRGEGCGETLTSAQKDAMTNDPVFKRLVHK